MTLKGQPPVDPLPAQPWSADVRIWRNADTDEPAGASIPHTVIWDCPERFYFGYGGSGLADLALNILNAFVPPSQPMAINEFDTGEDYVERDDDPVRCYHGVCSSFAARWHQAFKREFIAPLPPEGGTLSASVIQTWIAERRNRWPYA